jgi:hypothetical protein
LGAAGLACVYLLCGSVAEGQQLKYTQYLKLDEQSKQRLVRAYVRRDEEGFWAVHVSLYRVRTPISPEYALRTAVVMDDFYAKFTSILADKLMRNYKPQVAVFPDRESYARYLIGMGVDPGYSVGMCFRGGDHLAAYRARDEEYVQRVLFHEGTHQMVAHYTGRSRIPIWFNEGLATNIETWDLAMAPIENIKRSPLVSAYTHAMAGKVKNGKLPSLDDLVSMTHEEWSKSVDVRDNYATAWSFVNFLLDSEEGRRKLNEILLGVRTGVPMTKILPPSTVKELEASWHRDIESRLVLFGYIRYALGPGKSEGIDQSLSVLEMGAKEFPDLVYARFYRGALLLEAGRHEEALQELLHAEKVDPGLPSLYAMIGKAYLETGRRSEAIRYFKKAVKLNPADLESAELIKQARRLPLGR